MQCTGWSHTLFPSSDYRYESQQGSNYQSGTHDHCAQKLTPLFGCWLSLSWSVVHMLVLAVLIHRFPQQFQ